MKKYIGLLGCTFCLVALFGCASTQQAPTSLEGYSKTVNAGFVSFKRGSRNHKAFAVGRIGRREFFGFGHAYQTIEEAKERAIEECLQRAGKYRKSVQCFVYYSE